MATDDDRSVLSPTTVRSPTFSSSRTPVWTSADPSVEPNSQDRSSSSYLKSLSLFFPLHSQEFGVEFTISFFAAFGFGFEAYIPWPSKETYLTHPSTSRAIDSTLHHSACPHKCLPPIARLLMRLAKSSRSLISDRQTRQLNYRLFVKGGQFPGA